MLQFDVFRAIRSRAFKLFSSGFKAVLTATTIGTSIELILHPFLLLSSTSLPFIF
jgi:hypothetical protein